MFQWSLLFVSSLLVLAMATPTGRDWSSEPVADCGKNNYTIAAVRAAVEEGYGRSFVPISQDLVAYPHEFNNINNLTMRCLGVDPTLEEFPILPNGPYVTGSPGSDRVVYTRAKDGAEYCAVVTYLDGLNGNPFVLCNGS
ncbi:Ribonuclease/ribotoxin [Armillaria solidipes]|uniref:Ribonuclease/ribotoxin n=1 Tax=Armillaria solidipes TaxID=1076256 RepID=A0A2H3C9P7_9AGAR|nr:Ribonuclease/ribotoxin [Armillaria solidipes]